MKVYLAGTGTDLGGFVFQETNCTMLRGCVICKVLSTRRPDIKRMSFKIELANDKREIDLMYQNLELFLKTTRTFTPCAGVPYCKVPIQRFLYLFVSTNTIPVPPDVFYTEGKLLAV